VYAPNGLYPGQTAYFDDSSLVGDGFEKATVTIFDACLGLPLNPSPWAQPGLFEGNLTFYVYPGRKQIDDGNDGGDGLRLPRFDGQKIGSTMNDQDP
jgi:hypothetical protein